MRSWNQFMSQYSSYSFELMSSVSCLVVSVCTFRVLLKGRVITRMIISHFRCRTSISNRRISEIQKQ